MVNSLPQIFCVCLSPLRDSRFELVIWYPVLKRMVVSLSWECFRWETVSLDTSIWLCWLNSGFREYTIVWRIYMLFCKWILRTCDFVTCSQNSQNWLLFLILNSCNIWMATVLGKPPTYSVKNLNLEHSQKLWKKWSAKVIFIIHKFFTFSWLDCYIYCLIYWT